jgi:hypothetical protein
MTDFLSNTEFLISFGVFLVSAAILAYMAWLERRPRTSLTPRLIPTTPVILIFGFIGLLALVHILNMYGIHTGRNSKF